MKIAVIGSGPSGWAACKKLLQLGYEPTIIDSSLQENDTYIKSNKIQKQKLDRKLFFGSDLPYRMFPVGPKLLIEDVKVTPSFAEGGFSLVWGSTMLPYSKIDMKDWPIDISRLNLKSINISSLEEVKNSDSIDYKKFTLSKLRSIVVEKELVVDSSKLKKNELLKLLGAE